MVQITQQQALNRWDTLSDSIREEFASQINDDIISHVCEAEHIPKEKIPAVARAAGSVFLGFLHPEDIAREIRDSINIDQKVAESIASALNTKIFDRLGEELDKIYAPVPREGEAPKLVEEIKRPFDQARGKPEVAPEKPIEIKIDEIFGAGSLSTPAVPVGERGKSPAASPPPLPAKISPAGIFGSTTLTTGAAKPTAVSRVEPPLEPAPTMIHEEAITKPLRAASGFSIEVPISKLSDSNIKAEPPPLRPAILELGMESSRPGVKNLPELPKPPRVVHYTEFRTPLEKVSPPVVSRVEPREVKEITSATPTVGKFELPVVSKIEPPRARAVSPSTSLRASPSTTFGTNRVEPIRQSFDGELSRTAQGEPPKPAPPTPPLIKEVSKAGPQELKPPSLSTPPPLPPPPAPPSPKATEGRARIEPPEIRPPTA